MELKKLKEIILKNLENKTKEIKRVFHGRGNFYDDFNYLTVDSLDEILFATFFEESCDEKEIIKLLLEIADLKSFENFIVQRRYKNENINTQSYRNAIKEALNLIHKRK